MAGRERPAVAELDQCERLPVVVEMDARGSLEPDVVADDHRQVPDGHVLKPIEGVHRRGDLPDRLESRVACFCRAAATRQSCEQET